MTKNNKTRPIEVPHTSILTFESHSIFSELINNKAMQSQNYIINNILPQL